MGRRWLRRAELDDFRSRSSAASSYPTFDLDVMDPYAAMLRGLLLVISLVALALKFYSLATGHSNGGDGD